MKRIIVVVLAILGSVVASQAQDLRVPCHFACKEAIAESVAGIAVDKFSTDACIRNGCVESNAMLSNGRGGLSNSKFFAVNAGIVGAIVVLRATTRDQRNARIYDWALRAVAYVHVGVAIHNYSLAGQLSNGRKR